MKQYTVTIPYAVFVTVKVEAEDKEAAIDMAIGEGYLTGYVGNFGANKLVGVTGENVSIEAGDEPIEIEPFSIVVEET